MFSHLTLLNQHKRTHTQENDGTQQEQQPTQITVVAAQPNIVQAQNLISENGQLGHIQIVATEALEPAQMQQQTEINVGAIQQTQATQKVHLVTADKMQKCISCGGHVQHNPKRKGPKLIRCDNCIQNDAAAQQKRKLSPAWLDIALTRFRFSYTNFCFTRGRHQI